MCGKGTAKMNTVKQLKTPLTKEGIKTLKTGDVVELTGTVYTARDAAHQRIQLAWEAGEPLPMDFTNQMVFYAGPCPAKPGQTIGSIAATTSMRMDGFVDMMFQLGMLGMIGKGGRSGIVPELCKKYGGIYLLGTGGASALISRQVKDCAVAAYDDLGAEAIKRLEVEHLRLVVGIDSQGRVFQPGEIQKYKR
jgi:fumarate hydratase subunit beta